MVCLYCGGDTQVMNSRLQKRNNKVWRRRRCMVCGAIFTTHEQIEYSSALSVERSIGTEAFMPGLLINEVSEKLQHRKDAYTASEELLGVIVRNLLKLPASPLFSPKDISAVTADVLKRFDRRAYLRYLADHPSLQ